MRHKVTGFYVKVSPFGTKSAINYTVSQKTSKIIFVITTSNLHQIRQFFCTKMANCPKLYEVHSFSTSPNLCQCTTVLIADVPNCHITL